MPPEGHTTLPNDPRFAVRIIFGVILLNLLMFGLSGYSLYTSRMHYEEQARVESGNMASALEFNISSILDKIDLALRSQNDEAEQQLAKGAIDRAKFDEHIANTLKIIPEMGEIRMAVANGDIIYGLEPGARNIANVADRDYFITLRDNPGAGLFISKPILGRISKKWHINLARRVNNPDGTFAGVIHGNLQISQIQKQFAAYDLGKNGIITLRSNDLSIIVRHPETETSIPGNVSISNEFSRNINEGKTSGSYKAQSGVDGIHRLFAFRKINNYPLYINCGFATQDYLSDWYRELYKQLTLVLLFLFVTLASMRYVMKSWKEKLAAYDELSRAWNDLEHRVGERTVELRNLNDNLRDQSSQLMEEISNRKTAEEELVTRNQELEHEISTRKQGEEAIRESNRRMQLATESACLAVWDWDLLAETMIWDDGMFELYGTTREEVRGTVQDWKNGLHPEDLDRAIAECEAAIKGEALFDTEFRVRHKDETILWVKAHATVVRDLKGNPVRMVGINRDVTDIHRAEEEKAKLQAQLQQSQKMESLGTLAGGIAHDMNNVLGAILGLASAHIDSQPSGSPLHQALDTICKATERGGKTVKSLLSFARQSPAENQKLDMNAILREQVALLERTTLAKVRLQIDLEAELRPIVGDPSALTHAFMNLCVNAVDAMPENGTLTLHTRNVDNDWIEVLVEDNGTGMPKEVLDKAMEPFFTTKGTGKGTGLGLSMVFSTVKAHRGQMAIESEQDKGTRVRMRFPACEQEAPAQAVAKVVTETTLAPHGTMKVLLIDDDDLIQSSVQAILEVLGQTAVITAQSGEEALTMLEAGLEADLVILDMNMPGLGGIGTLPRLRVLRPDVPILLATGRIDQTALTLASAHLGVTLLSKPFGLRELQKHLEIIGLR